MLLLVHLVLCSSCNARCDTAYCWRYSLAFLEVYVALLLLAAFSKLFEYLNTKGCFLNQFLLSQELKKQCEKIDCADLSVRTELELIDI